VFQNWNAVHLDKRKSRTRIFGNFTAHKDVVGDPVVRMKGRRVDMIFGSFRYGRHLPPEFDFGCCLCAPMMEPGRFRTKWPGGSSLLEKKRDQLDAVLPGCKNMSWNIGGTVKEGHFYLKIFSGIGRLWRGEMAGK
jgi:hypothetical protein